LRKRSWILAIALAALVLLAGSAFVVFLYFAAHPRPPDEWGWLEEYSVDQEYFTAKEAHQLILPLVLEWHSDAVVTSASAGYLWSDVPSAQMQPDGRNGWWHFIACSNNAAKWVSVVVDHGAVGLGVSDKPWGTDNDGCPDPLPMEGIVDSDEAMRTASCLADDLLPRHARITRLDPFSRSLVPYSWLIDFAPPQGGVLEVLIDGQSGAPVQVVRDSDTLVPLDELPRCPRGQLTVCGLTTR
jgi:hypothetical protein